MFGAIRTPFASLFTNWYSQYGQVCLAFGPESLSRWKEQVVISGLVG
jgi:hypothetical protein